MSGHIATKQFVSEDAAALPVSATTQASSLRISAETAAIEPASLMEDEDGKWEGNCDGRREGRGHSILLLTSVLERRVSINAEARLLPESGGIFV